MKWIEVAEVQKGTETRIETTSLIPLSEVKEIKIFCKFEHKEDDDVWNRYKVELHTKDTRVFTTSCRQGIIKSIVEKFGNDYEPRYVIGKFLEGEDDQILKFSFCGDGNQSYE